MKEENKAAYCQASERDQCLLLKAWLQRLFSKNQAYYKVSSQLGPPPAKTPSATNHFGKSWLCNMYLPVKGVHAKHPLLPVSVAQKQAKTTVSYLPSKTYKADSVYHRVTVSKRSMENQDVSSLRRKVGHIKEAQHLHNSRMLHDQDELNITIQLGNVEVQSSS